MTDICIFLVQVAFCIFVIVCILQMFRDFLPSDKTIFGLLAIIAGVIGLSKLKTHFGNQSKKNNEVEENVNHNGEKD